LTERLIKPQARDRILGAAELLFADNGFAGTSVHDIAEAAGTNRALLFYYFKSKQQLFDSLIEEAHQALVERLRESGAMEPLDGLRHVVHTLVRFYAERPHVCRMIMKSMLGAGEPSALPLADYQDRILDPVRAVLDGGIQQGRFRPLDRDYLALSLLGMINIFFRRQVLTGGAYDPEAVERHTLDLFLRGLEQP